MDRRSIICLVTHTRERKHNQELTIVKGEYLEVLQSLAFFVLLHQLKFYGNYNDFLKFIRNKLAFRFFSKLVEVSQHYK